ncbi:MAG: hypothetical protein PHV95_01185 [Eubacteriales bacterium]|nr:hypothetical protein [Eubacteriales bacterium]
MDNKYALLFIRGERPIQDLKYDILKHPNMALSKDGGNEAYIHGVDKLSYATFEISLDAKDIKNAFSLDDVKTNYILLSDEELELLIKNMEEN